MNEKPVRHGAKAIHEMILMIRRQRVILDADLAQIYGVRTKAFNQAVKRNSRKFPADFMFQLTGEEYENLRSQFVTASPKHRDPRSLSGYRQF